MGEETPREKSQKGNKRDVGRCGHKNDDEKVVQEDAARRFGDKPLMK